MPIVYSTEMLFPQLLLRKIKSCLIMGFASRDMSMIKAKKYVPFSHYLKISDYTSFFPKKATKLIAWNSLVWNKFMENSENNCWLAVFNENKTFRLQVISETRKPCIKVYNDGSWLLFFFILWKKTRYLSLINGI